MSLYRRNILVGVVVVGAMLVLVWMVLKFGSKSSEIFAPPQINVQFTSDRADGLSDGSAITYRGVSVGRVVAVRLKTDGSGVLIDSLIDRDQGVPGNVDATIRQTSLLSSNAVINLEPADHTTGKPEPLTSHQILPAHFSGLQFDEMQRSIVKISEEVSVTLRQFRESNAVPDLDAAIKQINAQMTQVGGQLTQTMQQFHDSNAIADLAAAIKQINATALSLHQNSQDLSKLLNSTQGHVDLLSKEISGRLEQVASLLTSVQSIAQKIDAGKGTVGAFINDNRLYEALVDTSMKLNATVADLQRLIEQWEQEGVGFKLK